MNENDRTLRALAAIVVTMVAVGCFVPPGQTPQVEDPKELRVLSHGAWSFMHEAVAPLWENRTGTRLVEIAAEDAGSALQEAVLNKGRPVADVVWGIDNALFRRAVDEKIFVAYTSPNASSILDYIDATQFQDDAGRFVATPVDHGYISVNYDVALEEGDAVPRTLRDLASPEWAATFVTEDPRTSSPGLGFLIATVATFGEDGDYTYLDYWNELFDNGVLITTDWTKAYTFHYTGNGFGEEGAALDRQIVTSYTTSPAAEVYYGSFETPRGVSLEPADGVFHQIETVGILSGTDRLALAKEFVDFALSPDVQATIPDTQAIYPIIDGVAMPTAYADLATDPEDLEPASFSAEELGQRIPGWIDEWEAAFEAHYA